MKSNFIHIVLVLICFNISDCSIMAQHQKTWQWVNQLGGNSRDMASGMVCDSKNNLFLAGNFAGTLQADNKQITSAGSQDMFIVRYDDKGNLNDFIRAGGQGFDQLMCISLSNNNHIVLGGSSEGKSQFNNLSSTSDDKRLFVAAMDQKGKFGWITTLKPSGEASLFLIDTDISNHIYVAGVFSGSLTCNDSVLVSHGKKDIFIVKLDDRGNINKFVTIGGSEDDTPSALSVSDSGTVFLSATFKKDFEAGTLKFLTSREKTHTFLMALDDQLIPRWKKQFDSKEHLLISAIQSDFWGNLYVGGSYSINLVSENDALISNGYTDGFIMKYDNTGKKIWCRNLGTWYYDYVKNLICDNIGGVTVTGTIGDTLAMDDILIPAQSGNTAFALLLNDNAQAVWGDGISGSGNYFGNKAVLDHKGNLYFSGSFSSTFRKEGDALVSRGDQDVFIAKFFNCDESEVEILGPSYICPGSTVELSIEPGYSNIVWNDSIAGTNFITAYKPGLYKVSMYDKKGCLTGDTLILSPAIPADFSLGNDQSLPLEATLLLKAPEGFTDLKWQDYSDAATYLAKAQNNKPGNYVYWLSALDSEGCKAEDTLTISFNITPSWVDLSNVEFSFNPNPVKDWLTWSLNTESPCQLIIDVIGDDGRPVFSEKFSNYQPGSKEQLNFSNVPAGVYILQVKDGSGNGSKVVTIIKK